MIVPRSYDTAVLLTYWTRQDGRMNSTQNNYILRQMQEYKVEG